MFVVVECAAAFFGIEEFAEAGNINGAGDEFAAEVMEIFGLLVGGVFENGDGDAVDRELAGVVFGAVDRVDDPDVFFFAEFFDVVGKAFFGEDAVVGEVRVDALDDEFFDGAVGVGDPIVFGFFADLEVVGEVEAEEAGFHDGSGAE